MDGDNHCRGNAADRRNGFGLILRYSVGTLGFSPVHRCGGDTTTTTAVRP